MNIVIFLGHPAHYHYFKHVVRQLVDNGNKVFFVVKQKDILTSLLDGNGEKYTTIREERGNSHLGLILSVLTMEWGMLRFLWQNHIDILLGCSLSFTARLFTRTTIISAGEDDTNVVPRFAKMVYPYTHVILSPIACDNGKWTKKTVAFSSYMELAYLHPNHFVPNKSVVEKYFSTERPYFIIRFAKLSAHHDAGIKGINTEIAQHLIDMLKSHGDIYITSERELEPQFEQYRIHIDPLDMHHVMAFATLYIGDSQTMAAEAGVLGVPFVRFNDFVGRIGYLRELEDVYHLGFGVKTNEVDRLYQVVEEILNMPDRQKVFQARRQKMLSEKIDYAKFLTWFIENYPESKKIMKKNPDYQWRFK